MQALKSFYPQNENKKENDKTTRYIKIMGTSVAVCEMCNLR